MLRNLWTWMKGGERSFAQSRQDALDAIHAHEQALQDLNTTLRRADGPPHPLQRVNDRVDEDED